MTFLRKLGRDERPMVAVTLPSMHGLPKEVADPAVCAANHKQTAGGNRSRKVRLIL